MSWNIETVDNSVADVGRYSSLAIDSLGFQHIAYYDYTNHDLKYASWNGASWDLETVDSTGDVGMYASLALESNGKVHIAYYDSTNSYLKYATNATGSWVVSTIDSVSAILLRGIALGIDSLGYIHISYTSSYQYSLRYITNSSGSWAITRITSSVFGYYGVSLLVDSLGHTHISCFDDTNGNIIYVTNITGVWVVSTIGIFNIRGASESSIGIDSLGHIYISYHSVGSYCLKCATNISGSWVHSAVDTTQSSGHTSSIVVSAQNNPHISYHSGSSGDLKYASWNGTSWDLETIDSTGYVGQYTSLKLDSHGNPHISYYDLTNGNLKHAYIPYVPVVPNAPTNLSALAISDSQINLSWTDNSSDETGFIVERAPSIAGTFSQVGTVAANTTSYADLNLLDDTTYFYRVCAYNAVGNSTYTNTASASTLPMPVSLHTSALSGSESCVGWVREPSWGDTPVSGADPDAHITGISFFPCKEENIGPSFTSGVQADDMNLSNEPAHIIQNGTPTVGFMRFNAGPQTLAHLLTMLFGTPQTTTLDLANGVYQHVWQPNGAANWPVPYSIESQYSDVRSKLIQGAVARRLAMYLDNDSPMNVHAEFLAKQIEWLYPDSDTGHGSGTQDIFSHTRPARMTTSPTKIDEKPWHFTQIAAYPQIDGADEQSLTSLYLEPAFPNLDGLFTGGSGLDIGNYIVNPFMLKGRFTVLFSDEGYAEMFKAGTPFTLHAELHGDAITGEYGNQFIADVYNAVFNEHEFINQTGKLEYSLGYIGLKSFAEGTSCKFTIINTVSSYA